MPKRSKIRSVQRPVQSKPGDPSPPKELMDKYICARCGRIFKRQRGNFSVSHSPLYKGWGGYLPVCVTCMDDLLDHYQHALGSEEEAMKRLCMKFDIYWNKQLFGMVSRASTSASRIRSYISKTNLIKFSDRTFDDTMDEIAEEKSKQEESEQEALRAAETNRAKNLPENEPVVYEPVELTDVEPPTPETIDFWGTGFTADIYFDLNRRYQKWTADEPKPIPAAAEALYKQICISEVKVNKDFASGKSVEATQRSISDAIGALNRKPVQTKEDAADPTFDEAPFGVLIKIKEDTSPIPKPLKEFDDVDGIVRYISIWFLGHLCKMLGIKNTYCKMYEDEMARLRVNRPELDEDDDEGAFNDIFGAEQDGEK